MWIIYLQSKFINWRKMKIFRNAAFLSQSYTYPSPCLKFAYFYWCHFVKLCSYFYRNHKNNFRWKSNQEIFYKITILHIQSRFLRSISNIGNWNPQSQLKTNFLRLISRIMTTWKRIKNILNNTYFLKTPLGSCF